MALKREKSLSITPKQKEVMVDFIYARREMFTGKLTPIYTKESMTANWQELANVLNSIPEGPKKEWKVWRKTWVDLKKNLKAKLVDHTKYTQGTGGGPPLPPIMDKMYDIISPVAISGDENIVESEVLFDWGDIDMPKTPCTMNVFNPNVNPTLDHCYAATEVSTHAPVTTDASMIDSSNRGSNTCHDDDPNLTLPTMHARSSFPKTAAQTTSRIIRGASEKKRKITKTTRLQESLKSNDRFLKITESNLEYEREFKKKQLEIMVHDSQKKTEYYNKKIKAFETIASAAVKMADCAELLLAELRDVKTRLLQ